VRKSITYLTPDPERFLDAGTALFLNETLHGGLVPMDLIHLIVTGIASAIFIVLFVFVPLRFSKVGREEGATAVLLLVYFSCLGAGFIILELVFIQRFMHLIGSPLYTYSTVIFTMLFSAGIGSATSARFGINATRRWAVPFVAILAIGLALVSCTPR
jgi:hypothetical protein